MEETKQACCHDEQETCACESGEGCGNCESGCCAEDTACAIDEAVESRQAE